MPIADERPPLRDRAAALFGTPWYPTVLAAAFILHNFTETGVHTAATGRAFVVAIAAAAALQLLCTLAFRSRHVGSAAAFGIIVAVVFWEPVASVGVAIRHLEPRAQLVLLSLVLAASVLGIVIARRRRGNVDVLELTRRLNVVVGLAVAIVVVGFLSSPLAAYVISDLGPPGDAEPHAISAELPAPPDIFLFVLDGHPRADVVMREAGHDLTPFLDRLTRIGFEVADDARSNYDWTGASLTALLGMELLDDPPPGGPDVPGEPPAQLLSARTGVARAPSFDVLRRAGYEITAIGPPYESATARSADRFISDGYINTFECHVMRRTAVGAALWAATPQVFGDAHREGILRSLDHAREIGGAERPMPQFVLVHLPVPHPPALWDRDGNPVNDARGSDCAPASAEGFDDRALRNAFLASMEFSDALVAETLEAIVEESDGRSIALVVSDHGARFRIPEPDRSAIRDWQNRFGILFAAYTPGEEGLFPADASLVNVLPRLLNHYLGTSIALQADTSHDADGTVSPEP